MDYLNSLFQNIKDKLSSPFFGTLFFIILIHHWEIWYSIFNFDQNYSRNSKVILLKNLIDYELTTKNIFLDILWAVGVTLLGYLVIIGTRTLSMSIEFKIMPWITGKIVNKNVVLKTVYDETVLERDEYADKYEEQRKTVRILSKNYDEQTEQIKNKDIQLTKNVEEISTLVKNINSTEQKSDKLQRELNNSILKVKELETSIEGLRERQTIILDDLNEYKRMFFAEENKEFWNSVYKFPNVIIETVRELKNAEKWQQFLAVGNYIEFGGTISAVSITELKSFGVIKDGINTEQLTPIGEILFKYKSILEAVR